MGLVGIGRARDSGPSKLEANGFGELKNYNYYFVFNFNPFPRLKFNVPTKLYFYLTYIINF